jgi:PHD/YefM family antitoxin component YafN of YafNO toxin-antitoxin module
MTAVCVWNDKKRVLCRSHERYLIDKNGKRIAVLLGIDEYKRFLSEQEELESIRAFDAARSFKSTAIPFEQAVKK